MAFPGDVNSLGSVSGSQTLAAAGHATRHNEVKTALEGLRDVLGGTAVPSGTVQPILAAGSASAPSLSFTGDSNTGLWSPAADTVAASTGGTERMRIDNDGLITGTGTSLGAWTAYTPTWTATTTNPTIGNGTLQGSYVRIGKIVVVRVNLTLGSTTNIGSGAYFFSLPLDSASVNIRPLGNAVYVDASTGAYVYGVVDTADAGNKLTMRVFGTAGTHASLETVGNAGPWTWAQSDSIWLQAEYETSA